MADKVDILALLPDEMRSFVTELGWEPYRANQVFKRLHGKMASSVDEMVELSADMRTVLKEKAFIGYPQIAESTSARGESTVKFLLRLFDGNEVEAVLMQYGNRDSLCVSSQVGCKLACSFCATGGMGFVRDLTASEILGEVYVAVKTLGHRISNILYMGMGEPLDNYDAVLRSIKLLTAPEGYGLSQRQITISTCGVVPGIERLAKESVQVRLAVSLHAGTNVVRSTIMPVNRMYPIGAVMQACRQYQLKTGRRITFEYTVIPGVNDGPDQVRALAEVLRGLKYHINVIPYNPPGGDKPKLREAVSFAQALGNAGIDHTLRRSRGTGIGGGCGQLAAGKTPRIKRQASGQKEDKK